MKIRGHRAVFQFNLEIGMFRGKCPGLNGGADFYADSVSGLQQEGEAYVPPSGTGPLTPMPARVTWRKWLLPMP